jgi:hypothetical protein
LSVVDDERLTFGPADGELLAADGEVPALGVMDAGRHALAGLNVVAGAVHDNLDNLGLGGLDVVNLRVGGGHDGHSPVPEPR